MGFSRVQAIAVTGLFVVACGGDPAANSPEDQIDENAAGAHGGKDAGSKDAGKRDASPDDTSDDPSSPADDSTDPPAEQPDASSSSKPDASHASDAGSGSHADAGVSDAGKPSTGASDGGTCDSLTYDSFGKTFLSNYCVSCHGPTISQAKIKVDSLAAVVTNKAKVKAAVSNSSMPPLGSKAPTAAERKQFGQWIDCGPK